MDRRTRQRRLQRCWSPLSPGEQDRLKRLGRYSTDATLRLRIRAVLHCMGGLCCREAARRLRRSDRFVRLATQRFLQEKSGRITGRAPWSGQAEALDDRVGRAAAGGSEAWAEGVW